MNITKKASKPSTKAKKKPAKTIQFNQPGQIAAFIEDQAKACQMSEAALVRQACHIGLEQMFKVKIVGNKITAPHS